MARKVHRYEPRGTARQLLEDRSPELIVSGSAGTGKSRACLTKLALVAQKYDGCRLLMMRKTMTSLRTAGLVTWCDHVIPELLANGRVTFYGGGPQAPPQYRFANGSRVMIGGMDDPGKIMSTEYDMIFAQEGTDFTLTDWEHATSRLRNGVLPYQQMLADCNPGPPTHWLKRRADDGVAVMLNSRHEENPRYYQRVAEGTPGATLFDGHWYVLTEQGRAYMAKLDALTGVRYLRLRRGLWVAAEGLVFPSYDPARHLIDRFEIPDSWPRFWTVDFGVRHPFVLQMWAEDPDGRLFLYREIYRTDRLVEDHARQALAIVAPDGRWTEPRPQAVICDHDLEDRRTLERHLGLSTVPAHKTVSTGIEAVEARLRAAKDGRPRLFVLRDTVLADERDELQVAAVKPTCTAEEFPGYVWKDKSLKDEPVKEDDDGMDALRYMVAHRDLRKQPGVRFFG